MYKLALTSFFLVSYCLYKRYVYQKKLSINNDDETNINIQKIQSKYPEFKKDEIIIILKKNDYNVTKTKLELAAIITKKLDEQDEEFGTNMDDKHIVKEFSVLKKQFPKLDQNYILNILKKNKGHVGKATNEIFENGGEGVKEAKEEFYKRYTGVFVDKHVASDHMIYVWNISFSNEFNTQNRCNGLIILPNEENVKYPNRKYFNKLARDGDDPYNKGNWGTDPDEIYDESYPSNTDELVMTKYELETIINNWKIALLGTHPYTNEDGCRCYYVGKDCKNRTKKNLPEGWIRSACKEYNGLYSYINRDKNICQWEHPLD